MKCATPGIVLGVAGLFSACRPAPEPREPMTFAIICSAELLDTAGMAVLSLEDTMSFEVRDDSVATDPRPCRSSYQRGSRTLTVNAKAATDTVGGDPRD